MHIFLLKSSHTDFSSNFSTQFANKDYLNPIPKDEVVQECGLRTTRRTTDIGNEYYVTTIDPIELGINMHSNTNEEILFEDDFNFNYFGSNIMAWQRTIWCHAPPPPTSQPPTLSSSSSQITPIIRTILETNNLPSSNYSDNFHTNSNIYQSNSYWKWRTNEIFSILKFLKYTLIIMCAVFFTKYQIKALDQLLKTKRSLKTISSQNNKNNKKMFNNILVK